MAYVHARLCENLSIRSEVEIGIYRHYSDLINLISVLKERKVGYKCWLKINKDKILSGIKCWTNTEFTYT